MRDRVEITVWTDSSPLLHETVVVDYTEPIIDPHLWELLGKSQQAAWQRVSKLCGTVDEKVKSVAQDIKDRVSDSTKYMVMEEKVGEYIYKARKLQDEAQTLIGRQFEDFIGKYSHLFTNPVSEEDFKRFTRYRNQFQQQIYTCLNR